MLSIPSNSSTASLLLLDAGAAQVQGIYNERVITFTTSVSSVYISGALTGIVLNNTLLGAAGCSPGSSGEMIFQGGGGSGAKGMYSIDATGLSGSASISSVGSGYSSQPTAIFSGSGCNLLAGTVTVSLSSGSGCVQQSGNLVFSGGDVSATGVYITLNGMIVSVFLQNGGSGYPSEPQVSVSDSNCVGYSIRATLSDPAIAGTARRIRSYSSNKYAQLSEPLRAAPTNTTRYSIKQPAYATGMISRPVVNGVSDILLDSSALLNLSVQDSWILSSSITVSSSISSLSVQSAGSGCNGSSGTLSLVGGGGSGAAGVYSVVNGSISQVSLLSNGLFYTSAPIIRLSDPSCVNAAVTATLSDSSIAGSTRNVKSFTSTSRGTIASIVDDLEGLPTASSYQINPSPAIYGSVSLESAATAASMTLNYRPWMSDIVSPYFGVVLGAGASYSAFPGKSVTFTSSVSNISLSLSIIGFTINNAGFECASTNGNLIFTGGGGSGAISFAVVLVLYYNSNNSSSISSLL